MNVVELILKKRDGFALVEAEIAFLISGYTVGRIPDYQMAAFCMAVFHRGMNAGETLFLTRAMLESGSVLELQLIAGIEGGQARHRGRWRQDFPHHCSTRGCGGCLCADDFRARPGFYRRDTRQLETIPGFKV